MKGMFGAIEVFASNILDQVRISSFDAEETIWDSRAVSLLSPLLLILFSGKG